MNSEDVAQSAGEVASWFSGIVGENPSWDLILLIAVIGAVVFLAFLGRARLVALSLAAYMAIALVAATTTLDWVFNITSGSSPLWTIIAVLAAATVLFYLLAQYGLAELLEEDEGYFASSVVLGVAIAGMILSYAFTILPNDAIAGYSPLLVTVLTGAAAQILWLLAPMIVIGATRD